MRIVIDGRESGTSTGRYVDKLIEHLHKLEPDFEISVLTKTPRIEYLKGIAPTFEIIECNIKEFSFNEQYGLTWQLYGLKADLVHFGMTQQPVLYFGKTVTTIHDLTTIRFKNPAKNWFIFSFKQTVYKWVIKRVAKKSAKIIVPTDYVKTDVARFSSVAPNKIVVTYEAADRIAVAAKPLKKLVGKQFIMYVGRPLPHKNLERLVEAFQTLRHKHPKLILVLVGKKDALYELLEKRLKKQGIGGIVFTGFVSEGQLRWLYENTAAYVFPSLSEGFGLPGLEAMAHGTPVVSSNATCLPEVYGGAALYFDPQDTVDMARKISKVLDDPGLTKKLAAAGKTQAAKYSWQKMAGQTLAIYKQILN